MAKKRGYWRSDDSIKKQVETRLRNGYRLPKETINKISGENHWNWRGGTSFEPYTPEFSKELKEKIRKRDNYICQLCGMTEEENIIVYSGVLPVHHINYIKQDCSASKYSTSFSDTSNGSI